MCCRLNCTLHMCKMMGPNLHPHPPQYPKSTPWTFSAGLQMTAAQTRRRLTGGGADDSVYLLITIITLHLAHLSLYYWRLQLVSAFFPFAQCCAQDSHGNWFVFGCCTKDFFFLYICHIWVNSMLKWCHLSADCLLLVEGNINALLLLVFQFTLITADTF